MFVLRSLQQSGDEVSGRGCLETRLWTEGEAPRACEDGGDAVFGCLTSTRRGDQSDEANGPQPLHADRQFSACQVGSSPCEGPEQLGCRS